MRIQMSLFLVMAGTIVLNFGAPEEKIFIL